MNSVRKTKKQPAKEVRLPRRVSLKSKIGVLTGRLGQSMDCSDCVLFTDGSERKVIKTVVPAGLHGKRHLLESLPDLTQQKQSEEVLRRHAERLRNLHQLDKAILRAIESPEAIVQTAIHHLRGLLDCQRASIGIFDLENKKVRVFAADVDGKTIMQAGHSLSECVYGDLRILRQGKMEIVEDMSKVKSPPALARILQTEGILSSINVPLLSAGGLIGALNIGWEAARTFAAEEIEIAGEVADQVAVAIEQARLQQETKLHAAELEQRVAERTAKLESANEELEAFSSAVSHDLRGPIIWIERVNQGLLDEYGDTLDENVRTSIECTRDETQRLGRLVNGLLELSKVTRSEVSFGEVNLSRIAKQVARRLHEAEPERCIEFTIQPDMLVVGDGRLLEVVLTNLLGNAVKFTRKRERARIDFSKIEDAGVIMYMVMDNGAGFDMTCANKLFAPFQRMHADSDFPGTGIGLATVQRIIRRHGGEIWANARVDEGATFYFTLPVSKSVPGPI